MAGAGYSFTTTKTFQQSGSAAITGQITLTENNPVYFSQLVPASSTNQVYDWAFSHTNLQQFFMSVSAAATIKFYNASSLLATYNLVAGQSVEWNTDDNAANATQFPAPFASDVTSIQVTCTPACQLTGVAVLSS